MNSLCAQSDIHTNILSDKYRTKNPVLIQTAYTLKILLLEYRAIKEIDAIELIDITTSLLSSVLFSCPENCQKIAFYITYRACELEFGIFFYRHNDVYMCLIE